MSDTEGWSNRRLNERIQELEATQRLTREDRENIDKWLKAAGKMVRDMIGPHWSGSELATYNKLCRLMWEIDD